MEEVRISVRTLVEFILREGNIDNRIVHGSDNAMQEGSRLHRKIQKSMGSEYNAEVVLTYAFTAVNGYTITVEGRADGIIDEELFVSASERNTDTTPVIDEIKGTYRKLNGMKEPVSVHLSQAKCYAFMYADSCGLENINIRMTYANLDDESVKYFETSYSYEEIKEWFHSLMKQYEKWVEMERQWKEKCISSIKKIKFPYNYREGQKELVTHVYNTIVHGRKLYLEAPTGVGKTIATVFPTVKAIGEGKADRMFYLTAKNITATVAENAFELLKSAELEFKTVTITAKDKICMLEERNCNPDICPYAKGHYDRINNALYDILTSQVTYNKETILEYAGKHMVCPFEFSLDISLFSDGIICDYNYLFDPHVYLKRFFAEGSKEKYIFLVDEAHNLVDRGRSMYSASLSKEDFLVLKRTVKLYDETMAKRLEKCNHELLIMKRESERMKKWEDIEGFVYHLDRLYQSISSYLENHDSSPVRDAVLDFFFKISHFQLIYQLMDSKYITYSFINEENGNFELRLFCVDPSTLLMKCMERGVSTILFSATLLPIQYYKSLLGAKEGDYEVYAPSTFDSSKRGVYIAKDVTSKYTERNKDNYNKIAAYIHNIAGVRKGKYLAFFPSYHFLNEVYKEYIDLFGPDNEIKCMVQRERMSEEERREFLLEYTEGEYEDCSLVGFCVLGGVFSEGIDLKNDSLIGAIIVGTGLPKKCDENDLIKDYFDEHGEAGSGYNYAYVYPGFNKVLQAAGRVIRTHEDVGIVALLDYRFAYRDNQALYPREWDGIVSVSSNTASESIRAFWENNLDRK